jgi:hypothetical protein
MLSTKLSTSAPRTTTEIVVLRDEVQRLLDDLTLLVNLISPTYTLDRSGRARLADLQMRLIRQLAAVVEGAVQNASR